MYICTYIYIYIYIYIHISIPGGRRAGTAPPGPLLRGTKTGSYQTRSYKKGRFIPPKPKLLCFCFLIRPRLYASELHGRLAVAGWPHADLVADALPEAVRLVSFDGPGIAHLSTKIQDFRGFDSGIMFYRSY